MDTEPQPTPIAASRSVPFGERNRKRLIDDFFSANGAPDAATAWKSVYSLLLWIDRSTGLAHCYESDKCQPGRPWYARSLSFHKWLAAQFETTPLALGTKLDWLFQKALDDYLKIFLLEHDKQQERGARQRAAHALDQFPMPGADPEIQRIIGEVFKPYFATEPPPEAFNSAADRLREYWKQENKRKNLLGEGFEDVLREIVLTVVGAGVFARARTSVAEIGGFYAPGARDKETKVDLVIEHPAWARPVLVNVKWSIRADREDQLWDDFKEYVRFDRDHRGFDHYLVTNEFDPARLNAVCNRREANSHIFKRVVHINTDGILAAYGPVTGAGSGAKNEPAGESSTNGVRAQVDSGRLVSIAAWLGQLAKWNAKP